MFQLSPLSVASAHQPKSKVDLDALVSAFAGPLFLMPLAHTSSQRHDGASAVRSASIQIEDAAPAPPRGTSAFVNIHPAVLTAVFCFRRDLS